METIDGIQNAIDALIDKVGEETLVEFDGENWPLFALKDYFVERKEVENAEDEPKDDNDISDDSEIYEECPYIVDDNGIHIADDENLSETLVSVLTE